MTASNAYLRVNSIIFLLRKKMITFGIINATDPLIQNMERQLIPFLKFST